MPMEQLHGGTWPHPARLPLGGGWSGHCTAPGHEGMVPAPEVLQESCNLGYSRNCACLPETRAWDAVRFAVMAPRDGAGKSVGDTSPGRVVRLSYICERDHRPAANGQLEFDVNGSRWPQPHSDARIQKMAECFLESYLKKSPLSI